MSVSFAETKYTTDQYINQWKNVAISQMGKHKIPASITLAQGILESGNGNSKLAREAKNHFGIKCHSTWRGDTFIQDDDTKNECFRSYGSPEESYDDHSLFLGKKRYAKLFELRLYDYKGWAKGLKSAGYATNPKYAYLLIDIIEKYHLNRFDKMTVTEDRQRSISITKKSPTTQIKKPTKTVKKTPTKTAKKINRSNQKGGFDENSSVIEINLSVHKVSLNSNKVKYVKVKEGDTFLRIAKEFEITINQLYKYNEFENKDVLEVGDIIHVSPKRIRAQRGNEKYICSKDISLREIAHEEGIRLSSLMKLNLTENPNKIIPKGTKVTLR